MFGDRSHPARYHELYEAPHQQPFEPNRVRLTKARSYVVEHPDCAWVTRSSILIGISYRDDAIPDAFDQHNLREVVGIEPIDGVKRNGRRKGRKRP